MKLIDRLRVQNGSYRQRERSNDDEEDDWETAVEALELAKQIAEWHQEDGDECGVIARRFLKMIEVIV